MSLTKRYLERVSADMGKDGAIDDDVIRRAEELQKELRTPRKGDHVIFIDDWSTGIIFSVLFGRITVDSTHKGQTEEVLGETILLKKSVDFHEREEGLK